MTKLVFLITLLSLWINQNESKPNPVLLVSFDGFRADKLDNFLRESPNSNFAKFIKEGIRAEYMMPSFPSLTFPNHWTLVTGQYVESHGIVGNVVYYPEYNTKVRLGTTKETRYWNRTEPIWLTAKNQGKKTASSYWVGSEANLRQPDIYLSYSEKLDSYERVDILVGWYKKFELDFGCFYIDEPDSSGHAKGPESAEYKQKIVEMDALFGYLIKRLTEENILKNLNIVVVSDHGMAELDSNHQIGLNEYLDISKIDLNKTVFAVTSNIYPKEDVSIDDIVKSMVNIPNLKVYRKNEVPSKYYYSKNDRIAPIVAVSNEGYELGEKKVNLTYDKNGAHGYENTLLSMRAIFLANGPSFKSNMTLKPFQNINVYSLLCKLTEIKCNPSNGTIDPFEGVFSSSSQMTNSNSFFNVIFVFTVYLLK